MKKINLYLSFMLCFSFMLTTSCATLFKGSLDQLSVNSSTKDAEVYINGTFRGKTPLKLKLKSKNSYTVEVKKNGYSSQTYNIESNVGAGWVILDVLTGLVPVIVDISTGAWTYLEPNVVNADLSKK